MRHTRSETRQRRSHHALSALALSACVHCGALHLPHHICLACGWYKGRQVMDLKAEKVKRDQRLKAKRERISVDMGASHAPIPSAPAATERAVEPKEEITAARGAAAKRLKDESLSQTSTGTE